MVNNWSDGASIARGRPTRLSAMVYRIPFRSVKGALSSGASPAIVRPTGEELYARFIWWSIIGGVCHVSKMIPTSDKGHFYAFSCVFSESLVLCLLVSK